MVALLTIAVVTRSLGAEQYGVIATITALAGVMQVADFGVGNGLVARLAAAVVHGDEVRGQRLISCVGVLLVAFGAGAGLLVAALSAVTSLGELIGIPVRLHALSQPAVKVFFLLLVMAIPFGLVVSVEEGLQAGVRRNAWSACGSSLSLLGVIACAHYRASIGWVMLSVCGGPLLGLLGNGVHLFAAQPALRPRIRLVDSETLREVLGAGRLFLVLQAAVAVGYETDTLIVAHVLGPRAVASYSVAAAIFFPIMGAVAVTTRPLWAAYGEAIAGGDVEWVRAAFRRSVVIVAASTCLGASGLLVVAGSVSARLAGHRIDVPTSLFIAFSFWTVLGSTGTAAAMLLNALHVVRPQVICAIAMAVTNTLLSIYLCGRMGTSGVVWGSVVAYTVCVAIPLAFIVPRVLRGLSGSGDPTNG